MAATGFPAFLSLFLMHCLSYMSTIIFGQVLILFVFSALSPFCPTVVSFVGGLWYCLFLSQFFHSASHLSSGQDVRRALKTFAHLIGVLFTFYWSSSLSCGRAANGLKIPLLLHQQVSWVCPCFSPHLERHVFLQRNRTIAKKELVPFTQLVKVRGGNLVWALPSIRFSWNFYQIISGTKYE